MAENRELALVLKLVADQFKSELKASGGALGEFNRFISDWKTQLAGATGALFAIAKSTANYGEELLKSSQKTGVAVQAYAGMQYAAHLADLSNEQFAQGLKFLSVNMVEAGRNTGDGEQLFRRLGVAATDAAGKLRPTEAVLLDVAEAFANSQDGAGKAEMAVKLFGKAGLELIPFLNQGKTGIKELMDEAAKLGLVMSQQDAEAANRFNDELKKMQGSLRGLTIAVGKEMIPAFIQLMSATKDLVQTFTELGVGSVINAGMKALQTHLIGINTLVKEVKANWQFLFGTGAEAMKFSQLKERIAYIEAEGKEKLRSLSQPGPAFSAQGAGGPAKTGPTREIAELADQEKLGKALVEIFKSQNAALEIRNKLAQEGTNEFQLAFDRQEQFRKEDEAEQEKRGAMIVEQTGMQVKIRDEALAKERAGLIENSQAWVNYYEELGGDAENLYTHKMNLLRAHLAQELELNQRQAANLLMAWQTHDSARAEDILANSPKSDVQKETVELNTMRQSIMNLNEASGDFFEGWARGMRNYIKDTKSGFGLAADMARRTAQAMETGFRTFFFDAMEGRIKGLKDVFKSLLDFAKQMMSQIMAQMVMAGVAKGFASGIGAGAGANAGPGASDFSGANFPQFAMGGVGSFGAGSMAMLHGREAVVPLPDGRSIPVTMQSMGAGSPSVSVPIYIEVINQVQGAKVETQQSTGADGKQQIRMLVRQEVKSAFAEGAFDHDMSRFGNKPKPFGR